MTQCNLPPVCEPDDTCTECGERVGDHLCEHCSVRLDDHTSTCAALEGERE